MTTESQNTEQREKYAGEQKYIGTKTLDAWPMNLGEYNKFRGWTIPENENPEREGYTVQYPDGYISWSPKEVFEEAYRPFTGMTFALAIEALKKGKRVARQGWNGKGMFIFERPADELEVGFIIEKVKSLPQSVKDFFKSKDEKEAPSEQGLAKVKFGAYLCMYAADGSIVNGWLASQTDILAEDWCIVE